MAMFQIRESSLATRIDEMPSSSSWFHSVIIELITLIGNISLVKIKLLLGLCTFLILLHFWNVVIALKYFKSSLKFNTIYKSGVFCLLIINNCEWYWNIGVKLWLTTNSDHVLSRQYTCGISSGQRAIHGIYLKSPKNNKILQIGTYFIVNSKQYYITWKHIHPIVADMARICSWLRLLKIEQDEYLKC